MAQVFVTTVAAIHRDGSVFLQEELHEDELQLPRKRRRRSKTA